MRLIIAKNGMFRCFCFICRKELTVGFAGAPKVYKEPHRHAYYCEACAKAQPQGDNS